MAGRHSHGNRKRRGSGLWWKILIPLLVVGLAAGFLFATIPGKRLLKRLLPGATATPAPVETPAETPVLTSTPGMTLLPIEEATEAPTPAPTPTPTLEPTPTPTPDPWSAYFAEEERVEVVADTSWDYYSADLGVHIRKVYLEDCASVFFIAHIYTRDSTGDVISGLQNEDTAKAVAFPQDLARKYNAVYAQNGNYPFDSENDNRGPDIRNGILYKATLGPNCMAFLPDGELKIFEKGRDDYSAQSLLDMGAAHVYGFGPILVENGTVRTDLSSQPLKNANPRSAFGMVEPGHYVGIVVDGRKPGISKGVTTERLAQAFVDEGCVVAYNLDGGQSSAMVFMGDQINDHKNESKFNGQRRVPDILVIGTSEMSPYSEYIK